jgi:hypothetical protein
MAPGQGVIHSVEGWQSFNGLKATARVAAQRMAQGFAYRADFRSAQPSAALQAALANAVS